MGRKFHYLAVISFMVFLSTGCGELTPPEERREQAGAYTVRPGDTLYSIAWAYGLDYRELAAWNNVPAPYLIHPGQQLTMTPPPVRQATSLNSRASDKKSKEINAPIAKTVPNIPLPHSQKRKSRNTKPPKKVRDDKKMRTSSLVDLENEESPTKINNIWRWPAEGRLLAQFDAASGKKGIDIAGKSGQPVYSAAAGDVVYSGSGLLGYGNLVIIKHDDVFLSAYGHNSQLLVKEGDKVAIGQEIAKMGITPKDGALLHFEIRKEGKPVDPNKYLPKKN